MIWDTPAKPKACLVLAHGAGAGMTHKSMEAVAQGLVARGIAVLRYNFPYMERGSKRVDPPPVAHKAVRAAVAAARERAAPSCRSLPAGRSFGGRMTSQAQANAPLEGVRGLVFFAFPLHPAGAPSDARAAHLNDVKIPMLFLPGTRDALADLTLLRPVVKSLGPARHLGPGPGCRPFVPCARQNRAQGRASPGRTSRCRGVLDAVALGVATAILSWPANAGHPSETDPPRVLRAMQLDGRHSGRP